MYVQPVPRRESHDSFDDRDGGEPTRGPELLYRSRRAVDLALAGSLGVGLMASLKRARTANPL